MNIMSYKLRYLAIAVLLWSLAADADETRVYRDMDDTEIALPAKIEKIVNLWGANHQMMTLIGHCDAIIGTTSYMKGLPWFEKFCPNITNAPVVVTADGRVNTEEMLRLDPDVIVTNNKKTDELREAGLDVVNLHFEDYAGLQRTMLKTAELFGSAEMDEARRFNSYFQSNIERIKSISDGIPPEERKKVLYIRPDTGSGYLVTDGKGTMASQWITLVGAESISDGVTDGWAKSLTMEHVIAADPDVIILMDEGADGAKEHMLSDPAWQGLSAVKKERVFINPSAVFYWERYGAEEALQVLWAAKTIYPDRFADIDIRSEAEYFYKTFFNYELNDGELDEILNVGKNGAAQ